MKLLQLDDHDCAVISLDPVELLYLARACDNAQDIRLPGVDMNMSGSYYAALAAFFELAAFAVNSVDAQSRQRREPLTAWRLGWARGTVSPWLVERAVEEAAEAEGPGSA